MHWLGASPHLLADACVPQHESLVAGLQGGIASAPGWLLESVADHHAPSAVASVAVTIGAAGWLAGRVTDARGEGVEPTTLHIPMAGVAGLLGGSVALEHRRGSSRFSREP